MFLILWTQTFSKKLEYRILVESTEIGNVTFLYKTALSETYVKMNRMKSTKWTYHKERSFASNNFPFFKTQWKNTNIVRTFQTLFEHFFSLFYLIVYLYKFNTNNKEINVIF